MLPFKHKTKSETKIIEDGLGNSLEVPFYGCLTPNEKLDLVNLRLTLPGQEGMSQSRFELASVAAFLSRRFASDISPEDVANQAGSFQMVHALYQFLEGEERAWETQSVLLEVVGVDAKSVAEDYAQSVNGTVATREDLKIVGRYFVFSSPDVVPSDYEVEGKLENPSKSLKEEKALRSSSPKSIGNLGEDSQGSSGLTNTTSEIAH